MEILFKWLMTPEAPEGPMVVALKELRTQSNTSYKLGYLGELMDENYTAAIEHNRLLYKANHLKRLKYTEENPEVVDIAFTILEEMLREENIQLPIVNEGRPPYYPNWWAIAAYTILIGFLMTVAIAVIISTFYASAMLVTTLIVLVFLIGIAAFIYIFSTCVTYIDI